MNVASISSATNANAAQFRSEFRQRANDFKALNNALQNGDLSGAQSAFAAFQHDIQGLSQVRPGNASAANNGPLSKDLESLQAALKGGDLAGAQKALATLKQDFPSAHAHGPHAHRADHDGDADDGGAASVTDAAISDSGGSALTPGSGLINVQA